MTHLMTRATYDALRAGTTGPLRTRWTTGAAAPPEAAPIRKASATRKGA